MPAGKPDALPMHGAEDRSHHSIYLRFVALSLVALAAVAATAVWASKNRALEHEMLEAHLAIEHVAFELVASSRSDGTVVDARQATLAADLTHDLRLAHMSEAIVVDETGTIVYALDPALVGQPSPGCVTEHHRTSAPAGSPFCSQGSALSRSSSRGGRGRWPSSPRLPSQASCCCSSSTSLWRGP
jgi:hypothetical protein